MNSGFVQANMRSFGILGMASNIAVINIALANHSPKDFFSSHDHLFVAAGFEEAVKKDGGTGGVLRSCPVRDQNQHGQQQVALSFLSPSISKRCRMLEGYICLHANVPSQDKCC